MWQQRSASTSAEKTAVAPPHVAMSVASLATTVLMSWENKEYKIGGVVQSSSSVKYQIDGDPI